MSSEGFLSRPPNFTRNFAYFMAYKDSSFLYLASDLGVNSVDYYVTYRRTEY